MYGSSVARVLHGRGDHQTRAAFSSGYYQAGGFFSKLKGLGGKANSFLNKTVVGKAITAVVPGASSAAMALSAASKVGLVGGGAKKAPTFRAAGAPARRRRAPSRRRASSGRFYAAGDWGDDGGRDKRGHFLNARGGHHHLHKRRRRHGARRRTKAYFRALRAKYGKSKKRRRTAQLIRERRYPDGSPSSLTPSQADSRNATQAREAMVRDALRDSKRREKLIRAIVPLADAVPELDNAPKRRGATGYW